MFPKDEKQFAENVQSYRQRLGWSQGELARRMVAEGWDSYSQMTVSRTEKLERPIRLAEARSLAKILGRTVEDMVANPESAESVVRGLEVANDQLLNTRQQIRRSFSEWVRACGFAAASIHRFEKAELSDKERAAAAPLIASIERRMLAQSSDGDVEASFKVAETMVGAFDDDSPVAFLPSDGLEPDPADKRARTRSGEHQAEE